MTIHRHFYSHEAVCHCYEAQLHVSMKAIYGYLVRQRRNGVAQDCNGYHGSFIEVEENDAGIDK